MSKNPIFVDARQPATLHHAGKADCCLTLQEAVIAWHGLSAGAKTGRSTFISLESGKAFKPAEIDRLHYGREPT